MRRAETLVLTSSFPRFAGDYAGGFVLEAAQWLARSGPVTVLAPHDRNVDPGYRPDGLSVLRFAPRYHARPGPFYGLGGPENLSDPIRRLEAPYGLAAMFAAARPLAGRAKRIVSHWMVPAGLVGAACCDGGCQQQLVVHGGGWHLLQKSRAGRALARWILRRSGDVVAVAACLKRELLSLFVGGEFAEMARRIRVVPMGLHVGRYRPEGDMKLRQAERPRIMAVGRLVPIKGFDRLIAAMDDLDATLWVIGDGSERRRLRAMCADRHIPHRFWGRVSAGALIDLYRRADIVALTSRPLGGRVEGTPRVLLEGMAAGCAMAATATGGIGDVLRHGENGLLDDGDPAALRGNLMRLLDSEALRGELGRRAALEAEKYDWSVIGPRLLDQFQ